MRRPGFRSIACVALALAGCHPSPSPEQRLQAWANTPQAAGLADYRAYLQRQGVAGILPLPSLLRSGRRWRTCNAHEFAVPPTAAQANIVPTLRAVRQLQSAGLLEGARVASAYRDEAFNRCEGGSTRSRHLSNNALDFDLPEVSAGNVERLCAWWRRHGPGLKLGLGFYANRKIHVDTSGFRTWGSDYTRKTSPCMAASLHA